MGGGGRTQEVNLGILREGPRGNQGEDLPYCGENLEGIGQNQGMGLRKLKVRGWELKRNFKGK